jgi:peptidyl-prolyl cis-trans isomerase D
MLPQFDQVAFSLEPGVLSDLVKTEYGFHVIKVAEKRAATQRPIDEVRQQIIDQLKIERAQSQASDLAERIATEIDEASDMDRVAKANGLTVQESDFFLREEPISGLGPSPEAATQAFTLEQGQVSDVVRTAQGYAILAVTGKQEPRIPSLDDVRDRVRDVVRREKALEAARAKAQSIAGSLKTAADFEAAAKAAGVEVQKSTDFTVRGTALPGLGIAPRVEAAVFALQPGQVTDPIATDNAVAVVKLVDRQAVTDQQVADGRTALRQELLNERRGRFFSSYMGKAKQRMDITINRDALRRIIA